MGIYSVQIHLTLHLKSLNLSQGNSISNYKNSDNQMNTRFNFFNFFSGFGVRLFRAPFVEEIKRTSQKFLCHRVRDL